jgi:anthranilate synthase/aminodeoxychorismate synthase-like glutamine amidotransferase
MLLLIDNYDSFAHNLARYFTRLGQATQVVRNDAIDIAGVRAMRPAALVISPGPCTPREAGASLEIVRQLHEEVPMLGVCLGHQVIAEALGAEIVRARIPIHGHASQVEHDGSGVFDRIPSPLAVGRYHSLVVEPDSLPRSLRATAWTADRVLMAFQHKHLPVFGVQFHPESVLTEHGYDLLANFLRLAGLEVGESSGTFTKNELAQPPQVRRQMPARPVTF